MSARPCPGLGTALSGWRQRAGLSADQLAARLYAFGFHQAGDVSQVEWLIRFVELREIWPLPLSAATPFCAGCRSQMPVPPDTDHAFIYLLALILLQCNGLGPPSPRPMPPPWAGP